MTTNTESSTVETIFKTKEGYNECDHCQSVLSPAAYFVKLVETIEKYIPGHKLKERRPDLFELKLDCDSTNKTKLYLEIANEIMEENLKTKHELGGNPLQKLATTKYPFNLPANFPLISIRAYLEKQGITLADVYKELKPEDDNVAELLGLSPEEREIITSTNSNLSEVYGANGNELKDVEKFIAQANIDYNKLERLLDCYNEVKKTSIPKAPKLAIDSANKTIKSDNKTIDDDAQALGFLHRFIRLANKLSWSFDELSDVLIAIDKNEINTASLKQISRIKSLQEKFKKPLAEVCKLYPNASISIEESKSEEDANNAAESLFFLQGVKESHLKKEYGIDEPSEPFKEQSIDEFIAQDGLNREKVERLLNNYTNNQSTTHSKKAKKPLNTEIRSTINVKEQRFLHNFTQLTEKLKLLFGKLDGLIKALPDEFKLKDLVTNVDNSIVLQKIWNISDNELTSLINYNDNTSYENGKSRFLGAHKQVLLARLMNISVAEIIQVLLHLNINDLSQDKIEHIIELNDWLNNNSITIEQLNILVNSSVLSHQHMEQVSEIQKELEQNKELAQDKQYFYDTIHKHVSVNPDVLDATHQFTKKHATDLQLLRLESLNKSIHNVGIIGNKAVFLGEDKNTNNKNLVEYSISEPRENVAVAMIDTKTIFFGGKKSENNEYSRKIDIYDDKTGEWTTESASEARDSAASAVVGNKAIFLGGNKGNRECSSQIDIYDYEAQQWTNLPNKASEARSNASVAEIGQKAIFFGGRINKTTSNAVDIYDSGIWTTHTASEARVYASVAVVDTKVIFFGGSKNSKECSLQIDIYDSTTNNWTTHTASEARRNASVAIVDGKAIFFGGRADQTRSNKIDVYDAKTEKWTVVQHAASEARDMASVAVVGGQAVFFGGNKSNEQFSSQVDIYDSITNNWTIHTVSEAHKNVSVAVIGTKAIFFAGKKDSRVTGKVDIYDSTSKSWVTHVAQDNELHDGLLAEITNSTKYCGKIDIYDNTAKNWKAVDIYKPNECTSISIRNNNAILTFKNLEGNTYEQTYTINLAITYDITTEELLNNAAVFTTLKMDAEDINNVINHVDTYNLKATWTEKQIKTLTGYKTLQDAFSGNELTLSQYTEWLRDSYDESKVTGKIAQLTNWDDNILNLIKEIQAFEQCFSKDHHPIDSLLKIKSFIDMVEKSGIDGKVLLKLGALHDLKLDNTQSAEAEDRWKVYNDTEKELKLLLSSVEGVKEHLEDQKRNILANYMLHTYSEIKYKNMRGLYAFLLIDVEMSDCSKISPLKAGLNSLQLYIHRCMLGLEEGATVSQELTEEMWDLLDNYREWEVTKKTALYPENYLNPTLRGLDPNSSHIVTAEYKALKNTLIQGNITNETAAHAYIKYFEDFTQLVNLEIVDSYFESEKKKLYILGRTLAEPYTYYYRIGNLENDKNTSPQKWGPWQKIEMQIPVKIARIIHAFGKIFVFLLQKNEKEKQIEDVSIDDSTLAVHYVFKKVDGSWSAQQKLPYEVKMDRKFEHRISGYLSEIDLHKRHIGSRREEDSANSYCESEIKKNKELIKNEAKKLKDCEFFGKLKVTLKGEDLSITSMEKGFDNSEFILKKNLRVRSFAEENIEENIEEKNRKKRKVGLRMKDVDGKLDKLEKKLNLNVHPIAIDMEKPIDEEKLQAVLDYLEQRLKSVGWNYAVKYSFAPIFLVTQKGEQEEIKKKIQELEKEVETLRNAITGLTDDWSEEEYKKHKTLSKPAAQESIDSLYKTKEDKYKQDVSDKTKELTEIRNSIKNISCTKPGSTKSKLEEKRDEIIDCLEKNKTIIPAEITLDKVIEIKWQDKLGKVNSCLDKNATRLEEGTKQEIIDYLKQDIEILEKSLDALQAKYRVEGADLPEKPVDKEELETMVDKLSKRFMAIKEKIRKKGTATTERHTKDLNSLEKQETYVDDKIKAVKDKITKLIKTEIGTDTGTGSGAETATKTLEQLIDELTEKVDTEKQNLTKLKTKEISLTGEVTNLTNDKEKYFQELDKSKEEEKKLIEKLFSYEGDVSTSMIELVDELYTKAYIEVEGSEVILKSGQQKLTPDEQKKKLAAEFSGFYGVYLWEMFFHIPTLIAYFFNQEQKFAEARKWYQYIFNPIKKGCDAWRFIPFKTKCQNTSGSNDKCDSEKVVDSLDPYEEADKKKTSFEKYVIMSYVDNLIDWGDMLFSQNSWEGINQATMLYIRAWDLLGEKPKKKGKFNITSRNVCEVLTMNKEMLCKAETITPAQSSENMQIAPNHASFGRIEYCNYFCTPENKDFIGLWSRIEDRLYKIRHCLDIKGKRLELPLFQPPIDPRQLISAAAGGSTIRLPIAQVPHYRFKYMINYAKSIADTVTQIGSELLSALEKKDAEALTLLYNKQEGIMASLITTIKEKAIEALKEEAKALSTSLSSAKDRKSHYEKLIEEGWSALEISAMTLSGISTVALTAAGIARQAGAAAHFIPTIFGFSNGGFQPGSAADSIARGLEIFASVSKDISQDISVSASYERRAQDWDLQKIMATHDTEQISCQIEANKINQASAEQDLKAHKESIKQIKEKEQFFRSKFTNQELYSWMKGELKSLYIRVYRLALEIAKQAEWTYQYEIDNNKTFIQPGHWNSLKEGLLAGQKLKFDLEQLDKEYHDSNERRLEITKVISLKQLDPIALYELKTKGSCKFSMTEKLFDLDFPGHYARKIKDIKITIPAVVGPYENVHASLQQTSNQVVLKSEGAINAIQYLVNPSEEEQPENDLLRVNWKQNQEIAISRSDQDSGLFELSFGDERYLPFEGTGAVSTWELSLPKATNRFNISTISDVIIHLDYTALNGGAALSGQVKNLNQIKYYQGTLVANLSTVYPTEWEKFKQQAKGNSSELKFKLSTEIFPTYITNPAIDLDEGNNICIIPTTPDISKMTIKVNNYNWERNSKKIVNPALTIGSDWSIKINNADISKVEEMMIMVPYKATINW